MSVKTAQKTNPKLWEQSKQKAVTKMGGKHSARAMQLAVQMYKKSGGGYKGPKSETSLSKWTKQKWRTSDNTPSKGKKRYLPDAAWKSLTAGEKAATNRAKSAGNKAGKQFVSQPKAIAKKVAKFRK